MQSDKKDLTIPKHHRRVMVFDTETSGLMPKHKFGTPFPPMEAYPYIMQLSWIVFNIYTNTIEEAVDEYVQIPDNVEISPGSIQVHGITREITKEKGKPITTLLAKFFVAYMKCDCIVAHNLQFDSELVRKEMWRNKSELEKVVPSKERVNMMCGVFTKKFNQAYSIDTFCTMMNTIQFCGIEFAAKPKDVATLPKDVATLPKDVATLPNNPIRENLGEVVDSSVNPIPDTTSKENPEATIEHKKSPTGNTRKKFPRLNELYCKLFDTPLPTDMHNSIVDVLVCLRCFLKVRGAKEMTEDDFLGLIKEYSRV
jgi:DNA polymerase III epsilon subunit-like protein